MKNLQKWAGWSGNFEEFKPNTFPVWRIQTKKRFLVEEFKPKNVSGWRIQTEKRFPVEEFKPKNVSRLKNSNQKTFSGWRFLTEKRFPVEDSWPKNVSRLKNSNRKTFSGWRIQIEKRFPVENSWPKSVFRLKILDRKTFSGWNIQTEKRFPIEIFKPENVFRLKHSNRKTFSGRKFLTEKRFPVENSWPKNVSQLKILDFIYYFLTSEMFLTTFICQKINDTFWLVELKIPRSVHKFWPDLPSSWKTAKPTWVWPSSNWQFIDLAVQIRSSSDKCRIVNTEICNAFKEIKDSKYLLCILRKQVQRWILRFATYLKNYQVNRLIWHR